MKKLFNFKSLLVIFAIGYVSYIFITQQATMKRQKLEIINWQEELQKVKEENIRLQDEVKMSQTDKYIEKLAREKLGLIKQGEIPIIDYESNNEEENE